MNTMNGVHPNFQRPHHQRIARVLAALDADLLRQHGCYFGGGTCIALRFGEFRESVDIDFLVSDAQGYSNLRQRMTDTGGVVNITKVGAIPLIATQNIRADQYGIRTALLIDDYRIKFEIVREGRIKLQEPTVHDVVCGISTLTPLDMAASKLLANSDRYADDSVLSRDIIDLAMMGQRLPHLRQALAKAEQAYGGTIIRDLGNAIERIKTRPDWLEHCMLSMNITVPKAVLWQKIHALKKLTQAGL